jgi:membrane protein
VPTWHQARSWFERWLFAAPGSTGRGPRARRVAQYPYALLRDFLGGQLNIHAMGLVYATLLALVPLVAFSFAILRLFGAHRALEPLIYEFFRPMGDGSVELTRKVMDFADHVRGGIVGSVGLALLISTLLGTLRKVEDSLNFVWHVEQPRSFMRRITEYLALLVVAPLLLGVLVGMARITAANSSVQLLSQLPLLAELRRLALALTPYAIISAGLSLVYALIPNTRVRPVPALVGGLAAGVLWTAVGGLFATIVVYSAQLEIVYAGFAIFVAALIWIYVGWLILLLGAQLSFYVQNPSYLRLGLREPRLSNTETEQLALSIMFLVARSHLGKGERWSVNALAAELALPGVVVTRLVDALEAAGLLVTTEQETLVPARDAGRIGLQEILAVARAANSVHGAIAQAALPAVVRVCADFDSAWRDRIGAQTLETWVVNSG